MPMCRRETAPCSRRKALRLLSIAVYGALAMGIAGCAQEPTQSRQAARLDAFEARQQRQRPRAEVTMLYGKLHRSPVTVAKPLRLSTSTEKRNSESPITI